MNKIVSNRKLQTCCFFYIKTAAMILWFSAIMKIISAIVVEDKVMNEIDGIFLIPNRTLFLIIGAIEMLAAIYLLFFHIHVLTTKLSIIASLCTGFMLYRLGVKYFNLKASCACLGSNLSWWPALDPIKDNLSKFFLLYLIIGLILSILALNLMKPHRKRA